MLVSEDVRGDPSRTQLRFTEYSPFGSFARKETSSSPSSPVSPSSPYFTGKRLDSTTGLYYFGARYYDPDLGRFIQPDTIVQAPSDPQTLNRYTYCRNNPLIYTDPTGHSFWKKVGKFFKMAAAIIITVAVAVLTGGAGLALLPTAGAWALGGFVGGFAGTLINGGSFGQAVGMGFVGAFAGGVGSVAFTGLANVARIAAMTAIGATAGASGAAIMGGNIGLGAAAGAAAGFIGGAVGGRLADAWDPGIARTAAGIATAAAAGAASAAIAGGNAGQGALLGVTGAITYAVASASLQKAIDIARARGGEPAVAGASKAAFDPEQGKILSQYGPRQMGADGTSEVQLANALEISLDKVQADIQSGRMLMSWGNNVMTVGGLVSAAGGILAPPPYKLAAIGTGLAITAAGGALTLYGGARVTRALADYQEIQFRDAGIE